MKKTEVLNTIDELTKSLVRENNKMLTQADSWTRTSERVRTITVDGREAVLIG